MVFADAVSAFSWLKRAGEQIAVADLAGYAFPPTLLSRVKAGLDEGRARAARAEGGGDGEEVLLERFARGRVVAAGALHFHAEEGRADDRALGRHGHIILRSGGKAGWSAE